MKFILVLVFAFVSVSCYCQKDSLSKAKPVKKIDSALTYKDTVIIKIPAAYMPSFISLINADLKNVNLADWFAISPAIIDQIKKQLIKKPIR